ncbi:MAG: hypothetical protein ACRD4O_11205 [Bryobacteraceae bacterium]
MDKKDLARRLARESHRSRAQAADELDALLHSIFKDLKRTRAAAPALGGTESRSGTGDEGKNRR